MKLIHINLDPKAISDINNLMNTAFQTEDGVIIYKCHYGSKMAFYRRLLLEGLNVIKAEVERKRDEYEDKDSDSPKSRTKKKD